MADMAQQIRLARKRLRMNQAQFAEALGASQGSVSKWESGREVPRYETIEKISQMVPGFEVRDQTAVLKPKTSFELASVPVRVKGSLRDGHPPYEEHSADISALVKEGWRDHELEGWYFMNRYDSDPDRRKPNLGIFARLRENDRIDDLDSGDQFLVEIDDDRLQGTRYCLTVLEGKGPAGYSLWPISKEGRRFMQPLPLTVMGRPAWPNARVRAILVGLYTLVSMSDPSHSEP